MPPVLDRCPQGLVQRQKVVSYPLERTPYIYDSLVLMSPQQEHLEPLLSPLQSADDTKEPLKMPNPANQPFCLLTLWGTGWDLSVIFFGKNILNDT